MKCISFKAFHKKEATEWRQTNDLDGSALTRENLV